MLRIDLGATLAPAVAADVMAERDRRIAAGFTFKGKVIQSRDGDRENIAGGKSLADDAIAAGAKADDYGWQRLVPYLPNPAEVFAWICADNSLLPIDAFDMRILAGTAVAHKQGLTFQAKALKARIEAGEVIRDIGRADLWP